MPYGSTILLLAQVIEEQQSSETIPIAGFLLFLGVLVAICAGIMHLRDLFIRAVDPEMAALEKRVAHSFQRIVLGIAAGLVVLAACVFIVGSIRGEHWQTSSPPHGPMVSDSGDPA